MIEQLIEQAKLIRNRAYTPYSNFKVGAALLTVSGEVYTGCNIENAAYPVSCCAERVAIFNAISAGEQNFKKMVIIANTKDPVSPCGSCRQVMAEFFPKTMPVYLVNMHNDIVKTTIDKLLPGSFQSNDLKEDQSHN